MVTSPLFPSPFLCCARLYLFGIHKLRQKHTATREWDSSPVPVEAPNLTDRPDTEEEYVPKFRCSDAANGNGPLRLHGAVDVRIQPGAQFQSGGRPLRRLLEPDQRQVSGLTHSGARFTAESRWCSVASHLHKRRGSQLCWTTSVFVLRSEGIMPAVGTVLGNRSVKGHRVSCPILPI